MHKDYMEYGNKEGPLLVFIHEDGVGGWLVPTLQGHGDRSDQPEQFNRVVETWIEQRKIHIV